MTPSGSARIRGVGAQFSTAAVASLVAVWLVQDALRLLDVLGIANRSIVVVAAEAIMLVAASIAPSLLMRRCEPNRSPSLGMALVLGTAGAASVTAVLLTAIGLRSRLSPGAGVGFVARLLLTLVGVPGVLRTTCDLNIGIIFGATTALVSLCFLAVRRRERCGSLRTELPSGPLRLTLYGVALAVHSLALEYLPRLGDVEALLALAAVWPIGVGAAYGVFEMLRMRWRSASRSQVDLPGSPGDPIA